jgi:hypothetical protein
VKNHPNNKYRRECKIYTEYPVASIRKGQRETTGRGGDRNNNKTAVKISRRKSRTEIVDQM